MTVLLGPSGSGKTSILKKTCWDVVFHTSIPEVEGYSLMSPSEKEQARVEFYLNEVSAFANVFFFYVATHNDSELQFYHFRF